MFAIWRWTVKGIFETSPRYYDKPICNFELKVGAKKLRLLGCRPDIRSRQASQCLCERLCFASRRSSIAFISCKLMAEFTRIPEKALNLVYLFILSLATKRHGLTHSRSTSRPEPVDFVQTVWRVGCPEDSLWDFLQLSTPAITKCPIIARFILLILYL
jgi:hypothetical protein